MQAPPVESRMRVSRWVQAKATAIAVIVKLALVSVDAFGFSMVLLPGCPHPRQ